MHCIMFDADISLALLSKSEICAILLDVSPSTIEVVLGRMVKDEQLRRIGSARASKYIRVV